MWHKVKVNKTGGGPSNRQPDPDPTPARAERGIPEYCHGSYPSISPKDHRYRSLTHSYHFCNGNNPHFPLRWTDDSAARSDPTELKSNVETTTQMNVKLQLAIEDLVSQSKRQNLRVIWHPQGRGGDRSSILQDYTVYGGDQRRFTRY